MTTTGAVAAPPAAGYSQAAQRSPPASNSISSRSMHNQRRRSRKREIGAGQSLRSRAVQLGIVRTRRGVRDGDGAGDRPGGSRSWRWSCSPPSTAPARGAPACRFQILDDIASVADGGRSLEETLDAIAAILVPALGDYCMIDVIEEGRIRRAAVRVDGPDAEAIEKGLAERKPALQEQIADAASVARQEPRLFERVTEADLRPVAESEEDLRFLLAMKIRSFVTLELRARGRPTGILSVGVSHSGRRYRQDDADFFAILAGRVALALDNAGLFSNLERSERERAEIAATLQRGLLPPPLPHIPGWSVAAMYRPAGAENEIGGDFYDAFRIAGGWMVVIGDVTGRGAQAAAVTALARYTLRTAAALTGDPVIALETLNRELLARPGASLCSVAAMAIDEDPREPVRLAIAGHPAPLLVDRDAVVEATVSAPVLGAFADASWGIEQVQVRPGQQLVVITDGVTESTGADGALRRTAAARGAGRGLQPGARGAEAGGRAA